jgi:hypothetical protein
MTLHMRLAELRVRRVRATGLAARPFLSLWSGRKPYAFPASRMFARMDRGGSLHP